MEAAGGTATGLLAPSSGWWLAFFGLAVVELAGQATIQARVPEAQDWQDAGALVREQLRPRDAIVAAPAWTDPLVRQQLGDQMGPSGASYGTEERYERLWVLSTRGARAPQVPDRAPDFQEACGQVLISRWDLGPSAVLFDFVARVREAEVVLVEGDAERRCSWRRLGARGGGLGIGPLTPAERFSCDPRRSWLWVGATVVEDLELHPRHCIWQHAAGADPVRVTWRDIPIGRRMILEGGIYNRHERNETGGPIYVTVRIDGQQVGRLQHRDGAGWHRIEFATGASADARGDLSVDVVAPNPQFRSFCWSGVTLATGDAAP